MKHIQTFESFASRSLDHINEAKEFYRLDKNSISDIYSLHKSLGSLYDTLKAGNDLKIVRLDEIITGLTDIRAKAKSFNRKPPKGSVYEASEISEAKKTYTVDDFPVGSIIVYKNGEEWLVVKPGMRRPADRRGDDQITAKPYNTKAREGNISMSVDISIDFLNGEDIVNIKQS